jgi:hypothetical protein
MFIKCVCVCVCVYIEQYNPEIVHQNAPKPKHTVSIKK